MSDIAKQRELELWTKASTYAGAAFIALLSWVGVQVYGYSEKNEERIVVLEREMATLKAEMKDQKYFRRTVVEHMIKSRQQIWPDGP